jgi:hypothetical protein
MIDYADGMLEIRRFLEKTASDLEASQSLPTNERKVAYVMASVHLAELIAAARDTRAWLERNG